MKTSIPRISSMAHYHETYAQSINHPESFWHTIAQCFTWKTPYSKLLNWNFTEPHVHWFQDGTLNIT
ncbi:MAG: acetyl-coenzyme A synthetase N-terminal domain-containing protein, partial [Bacteroidia bacterium]